MDHKKFMHGSSEDWIYNKHRIDYLRFRYKFVHYKSYDDFDNIVYQHVGEFKIILEDYIMRINKKIEYILKSFLMSFFLMVVIGARGSGKTCFGFWFLEQVHIKCPKRRMAYIGVKIKIGLLPGWIENYTIKEYEFLMSHNRLNGYLVLIDEGAIFFNSRRFMKDSNIKFGQLIAISRQKFISIIILCQHENMIDKNISLLKDMMIYKKSNTYELTDRDSKGAIRTSRIQKFFRFIKQWMHPKTKREALWEYPSEKRLILFEHGKATFWTEELSNAFNQFDMYEDEENIEPKHVEKREVIKL